MNEKPADDWPQAGRNTMNYADFILNQRTYDGNQTVSVYRNEEYTLNDYKTEVEGILRFFREQHFQKNRSAMLLLDDSPACIALFLACILYGIVPVLTTPLSLDSVLEKGLKTSDATYLFTDEQQERAGFHDRVYMVTISKDLKKDPLRLVLKNPDARIPERFVDAEESAYFLMTSGSSGIPKIVMHNHPAFPDTNQNYAIDTLHISEKDRIYSVSKMCFGYGLANNLFFSLLNGAAAWLDKEPFTPDRLFTMLEQFHPTVFFGVPSAYRMILDELEQHPEQLKRLDSIRIFVSSGEPLNKKLASDWKNAVGKYLSNNMGSSESSAVLFDPGQEDSFGSAGWPVKGTSIRLEGPDGNDSDTGVMYFTSKGNFIGYRNNPEANAATVFDGWFRTGDVFRRDENGCYWGLGREDNMLKYHAMWVSPAEVEQKILEFGNIRQAVVYKMTVDEHDLLVASIVPEEGFAGAPALKEFLRSQIELYKCPEQIDILKEFPLNSNGKTDYPVLKKRIEAMIRENRQ